MNAAEKPAAEEPAGRLKAAMATLQEILPLRCPLDNLGSRATLIKAGMRVCGFMVKGAVRVRQHP